MSQATNPTFSFDEAFRRTVEAHTIFLTQLTHDRAKIERMQRFLKEQHLERRYQKWVSKKLEEA